MQLRGLLAHAPPPGASLRAPPPAPALWAKAHLSFSLLVAPRGDPLRTLSTTATAGSTAGGAAAGDGTVGGAVGRGGGGAGAQVLTLALAVTLPGRAAPPRPQP